MTREEAIQVLKDFCNGGWPSYYGFVGALNMAIEALQEVQKHEETFEWCTDCKEYDKDNYCCHRWSKMIRNTVEELKEYSGLVRCKDCRWQEECLQFVVLHKFCGVYQEISFCSHGERREP